MRPLTIALDAMGGVHGLDVTVKVAARLSRQALHLVLVGDAVEISTRLEDEGYDPSYLTVAHAPEAVPMDADPHRAIDLWPRSSVVRGTELLREDVADALVTAGHPGVAVVAAHHYLGMLPGVRRAAIAAVVPTARRRGERDDPFSLVLDVGATHHASASELVDFALMGVAYARVISKNDRPRVGLLSSNTAPNLSPTNIAEAHARLTALASTRSFTFLGNLDPNRLPSGDADVVVTEGFTGNIVIRLLEGIADAFGGLAQVASDSKLRWRVGLSMLSEGLQQIQRLIEWEQYGGAPLLGFTKPVLVTHANSDERALVNAIKVAARTVRGRVVEKIAHELSAPSSAPREAEVSDA